MIQIVLKLFSIILVFYGVSICMLNSGSRFFLIWFVLAGILFLLSELIRAGLLYKVPRGALYVLSGGALIVILVYLCVAAMIFSRFGDTATNNPEYLIVLGAQVKEDRPSVVLKYRLDAARDYLIEHPEAKAVLSGGQGSNEPFSEAEGMRRYLADIEPERLILEDRSMTTKENLKNSLALTGDVPIAVVTNNFHLFRAVMTAKKAGYSDVSGIAAGSKLFYLPNNLTREVLAVIKETVLGR